MKLLTPEKAAKRFIREFEQAVKYVTILSDYKISITDFETLDVMDVFRRIISNIYDKDVFILRSKILKDPKEDIFDYDVYDFWSSKKSLESGLLAQYEFETHPREFFCCELYKNLEEQPKEYTVKNVMESFLKVFENHPEKGFEMAHRPWDDEERGYVLDMESEDFLSALKTVVAEI